MSHRTGAALLLCALLISAALTGCREQPAAAPAPENAAINITLSVEPEPPVTGDATLIVVLIDAQGAPIAGAQVSVRGDMTHAGMTPVLREAACDEAGRCEIPFEWTMGGDWIVDITATAPDGMTAQQQFEYTVGS
jgi:hypothetical protein